MEFRVIPLQIRGLLELHEAARFTFCKQCNTGGTVVNPIVDHPAKIFESLCGFLCFYQNRIRRVSFEVQEKERTKIHISRKELQP